MAVTESELAYETAKTLRSFHRLYVAASTAFLLLAVTLEEHPYLRDALANSYALLSMLDAYKSDNHDVHGDHMIIPFVSCE